MNWQFKLERTKIATTKSLGFASHSDYKIPDPIASLMLYWKRIIQQIFSFVLITTLKINIKITVKLNFELTRF